MTELFNVINEMIQAFGPKIAATIIILVVVVYLINLITKNYLSTIKKFFEDRLNKANKQHANAILHRKKITPQVRKELSNLAETLNIDRALLFEFSNGNSNLVGLPFLYITATCEVIRAGSSPIAQNYQRMNTLILASFLEKLEEKGYFYTSDIEDVKEEFPTLYVLLKPDGVKSAMFYSLYGVDDTIGFVMIATIGDKKLCKEPAIAKISCASQIISSLLNFDKLKLGN